MTIIVTHDPDEASLLADEVLVIDQGRVLQTGAIEQVFKQPASMRVAELLGLRNVGSGVIHAPGLIRVNDELFIETANRSIGVRQRVMWRVAARAIAQSADRDRSRRSSTRSSYATASASHVSKIARVHFDLAIRG
ncbi:hypothetical protein LA345_34005 [Burkholderia vietnamiensis]|nr:hypothetical protein [Burkholderia vietnamiensis]